MLSEFRERWRRNQWISLIISFSIFLLVAFQTTTGQCRVSVYFAALCRSDFINLLILAAATADRFRTFQWNALANRFDVIQTVAMNMEHTVYL